jgi:Cu2+-exporting ATPase
MSQNPDTPARAESSANSRAAAPPDHHVHSSHSAHGEHAHHGEPAGHQDSTGHGAHGSHDKHAGHSVVMFRDKFWLSLLLTLPTLVWGHMLQRVLHYEAPAFPSAEYIPALFGTVVFLYGGWPFLQGAVRELRDRLPGMMTLIALAIISAFAFSVVVTFGYPGMSLWEELATLVTIMLLGHWIEMRSIMRAQGALAELAKLLPDTAERVTIQGDREQVATVSIAELSKDDVVLIRPGASVPADGEVREGRSTINESMVTGESRPVTKNPGDRVIAGTVNEAGALRVRVTGTGEQTALAGIMRLVAQAQSSKSRAQALADRAAFWLTLVALVAGAVTFVAWLAVGAAGAYAVERLVTVLVIACPHALGLAVPLVLAISTTLGARGGLLVRNRRGLEEARLLQMVVFDKTGTLTLGQHRVVDQWTTDAISKTEALRLAAALEQDSEHPVARAVVASAAERGVSVPRIVDFEAIPGYGVQGRLDGRTLAVGGPNLLAYKGVRPPPRLEQFTEAAAAQGQGVIYLFEDSRVHAAFAVADAIRPESAEAIKRLHALGIEVAMLTGDALPVAQGVARQIGIDIVFAQVLPDAKAAKIQELQHNGKRVAMVGDGVNDAPALATADVGIAIGAGTEVAVEAGDIVLVRSDPRDVARIVTLSRSSYRKMVQNLWWAAGYNIVAIPLAAGVLAPLGIVLSPAMGAVLMSLSTVIVTLNAQLLRRVRI